MLIELSDLKGYLPDIFVQGGTDDLTIGATDVAVLNAIISATTDRVIAMCQPGYVVPTVDPIPTFIKYAITLLSVDQMYKRRGQPNHAWVTDVEKIVERIDKISTGELSVDADNKTTNYFGTASESEEKYLIFGDEQVRGLY